VLVVNPAIWGGGGNIGLFGRQFVEG